MVITGCLFSQLIDHNCSWKPVVWNHHRSVFESFKFKFSNLNSTWFPTLSFIHSFLPVKYNVHLNLANHQIKSRFKNKQDKLWQQINDKEKEKIFDLLLILASSSYEEFQIKTLFESVGFEKLTAFKQINLELELKFIWLEAPTRHSSFCRQTNQSRRFITVKVIVVKTTAVAFSTWLNAGIGQMVFSKILQLAVLLHLSFFKINLNGVNFIIQTIKTLCGVLTMIAQFGN